MRFSYRRRCYCANANTVAVAVGGAVTGAGAGVLTGWLHKMYFRSNQYSRMVFPLSHKMANISDQAVSWLVRFDVRSSFMGSCIYLLLQAHIYIYIYMYVYILTINSLYGSYSS